MTHKQVIIIRRDLKMRRGKEIAQGAHASMGALLSIARKSTGFYHDGELYPTTLMLNFDERIGPWLEEAFTKITCKVDSEEELFALQKQAEEAGLINCLIRDSGKTEFNGVPTFTALAIGPDTIENIDKICGKLSLY